MISEAETPVVSISTGVVVTAEPDPLPGAGRSVSVIAVTTGG